jgi:undecaprenyl-diphosphatase
LRATRKRKTIQFLANLGVGVAFVMVLKYIIVRQRPHAVYPGLVRPLIPKTGPSFPSLHTFLAFLSTWFLPKRMHPSIKVIIFAYLFSIPLICIHTGIHWPSDVIAGAALGWGIPILLSEGFCARLPRLFKRWPKPRRIRVLLRIIR